MIGYIPYVLINVVGLKTNGKDNGGQLGLILLGIMSAFGTWSAVNPSFFTIREFSTGKEESIRNVRFGMKIGVALNTLLGIGLTLAYGKKGLPAGVATAATGFGLYGMYEYTLRRAHINNPDGKTMESYHATKG